MSSTRRGNHASSKEVSQLRGIEHCSCLYVKSVVPSCLSRPHRHCPPLQSLPAHHTSSTPSLSQPPLHKIRSRLVVLLRIRIMALRIRACLHTAEWILLITITADLEAPIIAARRVLARVFADIRAGAEVPAVAGGAGLIAVDNCCNDCEGCGLVSWGGFWGVCLWSCGERRTDVLLLDKGRGAVAGL